MFFSVAGDIASAHPRRITRPRALAAYVLTILALGLLPPLFMVNPVAGATPGYTVEYNPYAGVNWNTVSRLKTQLHCHTVLSDGGNYPYEVINQYAGYGFDALGISDHNRLTWPWSNWSAFINPASWSMVAIPNDEVSMSAVHFTAPFLTVAEDGSLYGTNVQGAINAAIAVGGIPIIAHPWEMGFSLTTCDSWTGFQGIEIYNPTEGGIQPFDFQLWDHLLTDPARSQKHIWGFAVDDSHDTGDKNLGWIIVYTSQKNATSVEKSIIAGSFIAVANSPAPINSITQVGSKLVIDTNSSVVWKADGQYIVGTTNTLDLATLGPGYTYVRAEVNNGHVFTQPMFIKQTNPNTIFSNGFEDGFASWNNLVVQYGTITQSSDTAHSGLYSAKITGIHYYGDKAYANKSLGATYTRINIRAYMNFSSVSTSGVMRGPVVLSSSDYYRSLVVRNFTSNKWGIRIFTPNTGTETYCWESGTSTVTTNTWYCVELEAVMGTTGFSTLWVDGTMKLNVTNINYGSSTIVSVGAGEYSTTYTLSTVLTYYVDDVVVANTYIGPSTTLTTLTVGTVGSGSVARNPDQAAYAYGTVVTLVATPSSGWTFSGWSGDLSGSANPATINMTGNKTVTATFTKNQYTLTVGTVGYGTTNATGTTMYNAGLVVSVQAYPSSGWIFSNWLVNGSNVGSANPYTLTLNGNTNLTALFASAAFDFKVSTSLSRLIVTAGTSGTCTVTATLQSGTTQLVYWSISGLPIGGAYSFNSTSGYPTFTSQLSITTSPLTPIDAYPVTITGTSPTLSHAANFTLDIMNFTESPSPFSPNGDGVKDTAYINANFGEPMTWFLVAKNSTGSVVAHIGTGTGTSLYLAWNGTDDNGKNLPDGTYTLALSENGFTQTINVIIDTKSPTVSASWSPLSFKLSKRQTSTLTYKLSEACVVSIQIYDSQGNLVKTLLSVTTQQAGTYKIKWDGSNNSGGKVTPGTYTCKIYATDLAGNQASPNPTRCSVQVQR